MRQLKIPRIWRRALVVAIPKRICHFGAQRFIAVYLYYVSPSRSSRNSSALVSNQSSIFRYGRSTVDQVTLLTRGIRIACWLRPELCFSISQQPGYDSVWHRGFTSKLMQLLPVRHMVRMIMEVVGNCSFTFAAGTNKRSKLRRLKNGVQQDQSWHSFFSTSTSLTC